MRIVFDTSIWISDLGLNSKAGAAVRFYIKKTGAIVAVPEVVRLELEKNLTQELQELKNKIIDSHNKLLTVFGKLKEVVLPSDDEITNKASDILNSLDVTMDEIPFSLEAAKSSFLKIIDEQPPSSKKNQQFKDGVIWANCLELLNESDVHLVSKDKSFYQGRQYENGLASNLKEETKKYSKKLTLMSDLQYLLGDIRVDVDVNINDLIEAIFQKPGNDINRILDEAELSLGEPDTITKNLYLTENASQIYIEFDISFECIELTEQGRTDALLNLEGSGSYDTEKEEYRNVSITNVLLKYFDTEGQQQTSGYVSLSATVSAGHKTIKHTVRRSLSD